MRFQNRYRAFSLAITAAMVITVVACSSRSDEETSRAGEEMSGAMEATGDFINEQRKEAVGALRDAYDAFTQKVSEFKERNAFNFSENKRNLVRDIEEKQVQIEDQLKQARVAAEESWLALKADISTSMEELEQAMIDFESP